MLSIMLGGSRNIESLPVEVIHAIDEAIQSGHWFLTGDAHGADLAFQMYLSSTNYPRVVVFSSLPEPRNNVGHWDFRFIDSGIKSRGSAMHTVKDRHMVQLADQGLMVWNGESPGTLANVFDFIDADKSCAIWMPVERLLCRVDTLEAKAALIEAQSEPAGEALRRLQTYRKREAKTLSEPPAGTLFD